MTLSRLDILSPVGPLTLVADDAALVGVFMEGGPSLVARVAPTHPVLTAASQQLAEYFAGRRTSFALPLRPSGTDFQRAVWAALQQIPFGATWSYGELARRLGRPTGSRAVGAANGKNPLGIVIPCHRVIGSDGSLTGYAGGVARKQWLLQHEGALLARVASEGVSQIRLRHA